LKTADQATNFLWLFPLQTRAENLSLIWDVQHGIYGLALPFQVALKDQAIGLYQIWRDTTLIACNHWIQRIWQIL
jgi:hypothetical protein